MRKYDGDFIKIAWDKISDYKTCSVMKDKIFQVCLDIFIISITMQEYINLQDNNFILCYWLYYGTGWYKIIHCAEIQVIKWSNKKKKYVIRKSF